jgi:site-specific DNA-cytosine methylase
MESPESLFTMEGEKGIKHYFQRILAEIIEDLKKEGFLLPKCTDGTPIVFLVPACGVGAPHRRYRVFIVAYNNNLRWEYGNFGGEGVLREQTLDETRAGDQSSSDAPFFGFGRRPETEQREAQDWIKRRDMGNEFIGQNKNAPDPAGIFLRSESSTREDEIGLCNTGNGNFDSDTNDTKTPRHGENSRAVYLITATERSHMHTSHTDGPGLQGYREHGECTSQCTLGQRAWKEPWIKAATRFCGVYDGIPDKLDGSRRNRLKRLKALGNAVVPAQIYPVFEAIARIEKMRE